MPLAANRTSTFSRAWLVEFDCVHVEWFTNVVEQGCLNHLGHSALIRNSEG
jgi:hypothetical protein